MPGREELRPPVQSNLWHQAAGSCCWWSWSWGGHPAGHEESEYAAQQYCRWGWVKPAPRVQLALAQLCAVINNRGY
jgi:hypothetical protein